MDDCVFCKIIKGEIPSEKVAETINVLAIFDKDPSADTHILILPKRHIAAFLDIKKEDMNVLSQMLALTQRLISERGIANKYKLVMNGGEYQNVPHLHWHILGGELKKQL